MCYDNEDTVVNGCAYKTSTKGLAIAESAYRDSLMLSNNGISGVNLRIGEFWWLQMHAVHGMISKQPRGAGLWYEYCVLSFSCTFLYVHLWNHPHSNRKPPSSHHCLSQNCRPLHSFHYLRLRLLCHLPNLARLSCSQACSANPWSFQPLLSLFQVPAKVNFTRLWRSSI